MGLEGGGNFLSKDNVPSPSPSNGAAIKDVTLPIPPPIVGQMVVLVHYNVLKI